MMNRREFVNFVAVSSLVTAIPEQVVALQRYYEANTPKIDNSLISIDEILIAGLATCSTPTSIDIVCDGVHKLRFGVNLFGGVIRWVAATDSKLIVDSRKLSLVFKPLSEHITGHISYIDQNAVRHYDNLTKWSPEQFQV